MKKETYLNLSRSLFFLTIFLIPLNLGKHYILKSSYVWGISIDYLIPTVYIQDVLTLLTILFWILAKGFNKDLWFKLFSKREVPFAALFVFSSLFSVLSAQRFIPSIYFWIRLFLYFLLFLYIQDEISVQKYFFKILNIVSISLFFLSILAVLQFITQGSVFDNYLFFGEQPYSISTWGVVHKRLFNHLFVPAYGTFRHSNTFGGFLSVFLLWLFPYITSSKKYLTVFVLGFVALLCTLSFSSWVAFFIGILIYLVLTLSVRRLRFRKALIAKCVSVVCLLLSTVPVLPYFTNSLNPSVFRRADLLISSYRLIGKYPLFGTGLNNFTVLVDETINHSSDIRFTQPVHNVFTLIFAETGFFTFVFFIFLLYFAVKKTLTPGYFHVFFISLMQILLLMSFDHYFFTANQTLLAFWIIVGLSSSES